MRVTYVGRAHHASLLVDPDRHRHVDELKRRADGVFHINEARERRLRGVVPRARRRLTGRVLRGGDDFEPVRFQLVVEFLPAWQIAPAASPRGPGEHQHFPSAEIRQADGAASAIGDLEVRRHTRFEELPAQEWNFAEAPHARAPIDDDGLTDPAGERGQIEERAARHVLVDWNADVSAAGALRLELELVDPRQIRFADPQNIG